MLRWWLAAWWSIGVAVAAPLQISHQGRLLDASGGAVAGERTLTLSLYDAPTGGALQWQTTRAVVVHDGYYAVQLGDEASPLSAELFDADLWIDVAVDGVGIEPRTFLHSVPFAVRSDAATHVRGGEVLAAQVRSAGLVQVGSSEAACDGDAAGAMRYVSELLLMQYCNGSSWVPLGGDGIPDAFSIPGGSAGPGAVATSSPVTLSGYDVPITVSVSGAGSPQVSVNSGPWSTSASLPVGASLRVRATAPSSEGASVSVLVTAGGTTATWTATAGDVTPNAFTFSSGVALPGEVATSGPITLAGYTAPVSVSVTGEGSPQIRVGSGPWATSGQLPVGEGLSVRATVPSIQGQQHTVVVTAGGVPSVWSARSGYDDRYLKTIDTPAGVFTVTLASSSTQSCSAACSARGLTCNQSQLTALQTWAVASTSNFSELITSDLNLTFSPGPPNPTPYASGSQVFFGLGCWSGTWNFTGFGFAVTGCGVPDIRYHHTQMMQCSASGYTDGNYSGPRICACN